MLKLKNISRELFEKFNIYIYITLPSIVVIVYFVALFCFNFNMNNINTFKTNIIDISLALTGILLTLMGLFLALPNTDFRELMKKYNHDKIINNTLFTGIITLLGAILLSILEKFDFIASILFLIGFIETVLISIKMYLIFKYIN